MVEAAAETAERWDALPAGAPIDVLREMATLTAEVICRAIFGPRLGTEHATEIAASFSEYQRLVGRLDLQYLLGSAGLAAAVSNAGGPPRGAAHPRGARPYDPAVPRSGWRAANPR